jgi:hypothetical protein
LKHTLDENVKRDPRILDVYLEARRRYGESGLNHHNFSHVMRDLYRALVIAEDEGSVDYSVLIPSVLLHDIGFCTPDFRKLGHDVAGARLAREITVNLGYDEQTCEAIFRCVRAHKGKAELPQSLEAKILYDADVLEKAGLVYLIFGGKITCELKESVNTFLNRELSDRTTEVGRGFYTKKAKELDGGRLNRVRSILSEVKNEILKERPDFGIEEQGLWVNPPSEALT